MAAQFTEVTLEEMERFLKRGWRALRPTQGTERGEVYFDLSLSRFVHIRVWTTIHPRSGTGAEVGADAIRIQLLARKNGRPLTRGKAPIVKRTQGWRGNLQDRIEDAIETYEAEEAYFEERSGGPPPEQAPLPSMPREREREEEDEGNRAEREMAEREMAHEREEEERKKMAPQPRRTDLKATFQRLRNGDWGLRVQGDAQPGDQVLTTTKAGKSQRMTVGEVVWRGDGVTVTTIAQTDRTASELPEDEDYSYARG